MPSPWRKPSTPWSVSRLIPADSTGKSTGSSSQYDRETLDRFPLGFQSDLPVFVTGMPRSGTSLVDRIIDAHPLAGGVGEFTGIEQFAAKLQAATDPRLPVPACFGSMQSPQWKAEGERYVERLRRMMPERGAGGQQVAHERESPGTDRPTSPRQPGDPRTPRSPRRRDLLHDGGIPTECHALDHAARLGRLRLGRLAATDGSLGEGARSADPRSSLRDDSSPTQPRSFLGSSIFSACRGTTRAWNSTRPDDRSAP